MIISLKFRIIKHLVLYLVPENSLARSFIFHIRLYRSLTIGVLYFAESKFVNVKGQVSFTVISFLTQYCLSLSIINFSKREQKSRVCNLVWTKKANVLLRKFRTRVKCFGRLRSLTQKKATSIEFLFNDLVNEILYVVFLALILVS